MQRNFAVAAVRATIFLYMNPFFGETKQEGMKMTKEKWLQKLTSRKLWLAVALFVSGLITAVGGEGTLAETVSGCIMQLASVIGYLLAEGLVDSAHA